MAYCTKAGMISRFGELELVQLTDHEQTGIIDDAVLTQAMNDADDDIDGYLAGVVSLPLSSVPDNLARLACDIARFYLYDDGIPQVVETRYDNAIKYLTAVSKGQISLNIGSNTFVSGGVVVGSLPASVFA